MASKKINVGKLGTGLVSKSAEETKKLGKKIAADLVTNHQSPITSHASTLALTGDLGSGKTTFVKGLAKGLGVKQRILSPTFILMRQYKISPSTIHKPPYTSFYHIDLYRLENDIDKELKNLGIDELWSNNENVIAIEWAEKVKDIIPKNATWISFKNLGKGKRRITVND